MKKMCILFLSLYSSVIFANDGNDGWVTASNFALWTTTYGSDVIRVEVSDGYYNPAGTVCTDLDSYMVSTALSKEAQQRIYSALLSASLANKSVRLFIDTNYCQNSRPMIKTVVIK